MQERDARIETLRGVAIILMVAAHVIGTDATVGMRVADDSVYRYLYESGRFLRMPLFTAISGYIYAMRPLRPGGSGPFLWRKVRRLLIPLAFVGTLQFLMRCYVPGINRPRELSEIWRIYFFPFDQFWFLQALFLVFLLIVLLEATRLLATPVRWLGCLVAACLLCFYNPAPTNFFSLPNAYYLLPFFILGCGLRRFPEWMSVPALLAVAAVTFATDFTLQQLNWLGVVAYDTDPHGWVSVTAGISGLFLLLQLPWSWQPLARLGGHAYAIYLLHVFGTAGSRLALRGLHLQSAQVTFVIGLTFGLLIPILIARQLHRAPLLCFLILGEPPACPVPEAATTQPI